jgi:serine/threonine protein kinase
VQNLYLVTDYYTGGSLFYHLRKCTSFAESRAKFYAAELLMALEHLHSQFIIYRDLKLENVLMDGEGEGRDGPFTHALRESTKGRIPIVDGLYV